MKALAAVLLLLVVVPGARGSTIYFATERVATPTLGVQVGIDGHGAKTLTWGPLLDRSAQGAIATAQGKTLLVDGSPIATVGWPIDDAVFSPDGRTVAFTDVSEAKCEPGATGCATWELWVVRTDGTGLRELSPGARYPRFSPDGRRLAFIGGYSAYDSNGTAVVESLATGRRTWFTAANDTPPVWAPGSNRIVYASSRLRIATVMPRRVRSLGVGVPESFSPDGRRLLYATGKALYAGSTRIATGDWFDATWSSSGWIVYAAQSSRSPLDYALYRARPDGSHRAVLRTFPPTTYLELLRVSAHTIVFQQTRSRQGLAVIDGVDPDSGDEHVVRSGDAAEWSPTVSEPGALAYMRATRDDSLAPCIVVADRCVTTPRTADGGRDPVWAPDGLRLAYLDYPGHGETDLVVLDMTNGASRVVRSFTRGASSPTWSPDGRTIVVASSQDQADGHIHLVAVDVATGLDTTLGTGDSGLSAAFCPVDVQIAFVGGPWGGPYELEIYDTQTGSVTDLGVHAGVARPAWSPDGSRIAYLAPDDSVHVIRSDGTGDRAVADGALPGSPLAWAQ